MGKTCWIACLLCIVAGLYGQERPSLLARPGDREKMRVKLQAEPYRDYLERFKSAIGRKRIASPADAGLYYFLTGDRAAAEVGKKSLLSSIQFSLGRWHSRVPQHCAVAYDFLEPSGIFSEAEKKQIKADFFKIAEYHMTENKESGYHNRNTDRYTTVGMIGLLYADDPAARKFIDHARKCFEQQLATSPTREGTWPETPRYTPVALSRMLVLGKAFQLYDGSKYLAHPMFGKAAAQFMQIATPPDAFHGGRRGVPGIGDAFWAFDSDSGSYWILAWIAPLVRASDPALAEQLMWMWRASGDRLDATIYFNGYGLLYSDLAIPSRNPDLKSTRQPEIGYWVMRENFGTPQENYAIWHAPQRGLIHRHQDMGSFSIYYHNTPVTLDSGSGDYGAEEHHKWFKAAGAHNVSMFGASENKDAPLPGSVRAVRDAVDNAALFAGQIVISDDYNRKARRTDKTHIRNFAYLKEPFGIYVYFDVLEDAKKSGAATNLLTLSRSSEINGNRILAKCHNQIELDIVAMLPDDARFAKIGDGNLQRSLNRDKSVRRVDQFPQNKQENFRIKIPGNGSFLVFLAPRDENAPALRVNEVTKSGAPVRVFRFERGSQSGLLAVNTAAEVRSGSFSHRGTLTDLATGQTISADGLVRLELKPRSMKIWKMN